MPINTQRKPIDPPLLEVLKAAFLNKITSGISPNVQQRILNAPTAGQRIGAGVMGTGQMMSSAPMGLGGAVESGIGKAYAPPMNFLGQLLQGATGQTPQMPQMPIAEESQPVQPSLPIPSAQPQMQQSVPQEPQQQGNYDWLKYLIPALTAGVGTAFPSTLSGAAGFNTGFTDKVFKEKETTELSPSLQRIKEKRFEDVYTGVEENKLYVKYVDEALEAVKRIKAGAPGAMQRGLMKITDPNNPLFQDWQKVTTILTDETLKRIAKTKGAISDREMAKFEQAVAKEDWASIPSMELMLQRSKEGVLSKQNAQMKAYQKIYGEDLSDMLSDGTEESLSGTVASGNTYTLEKD